MGFSISTIMMSSLLLLLLLLLLGSSLSSAFVAPSTTLSLAATQQLSSSSSSSSPHQQRHHQATTILFATKDDDDDDEQPVDDKIQEEEWDANVDYEKEWKENASSSSSSSKSNNPTNQISNPDPSTAWDDIPSTPDLPVLGIDISLDPISKEDAEVIKSQAKNVIEEQFQKGIDDIELMRTKMNRDLSKSRKAMQVASELNAREQSEQLMNKIDKMTNEFLDKNSESRRSTKLAAAASKAMEGSGIGIEMGTWGTLGDRTVVADDSAAAETLLGSVDNAVAQSTDVVVDDTTISSPRILIVADTSQDQIAKQVVPALLDQFDNTNIDNLQVDVLKPTATIPLGGNDADCVIVFTTSLTQASSLSNILDRLLRKTLQGTSGKVGKPPTQLVAISTVGTERFDKFPYSFQNMMGGKLESRRQIEEVVINTVKKRVTEPPLDYSIIKLGELKGQQATKEDFTLQPGDTLDDPTDISTAVETIIQAVAYQPYARNSTLCISGSSAAGSSSSGSSSDDEVQEELQQLFWDKTFLCLDGPEVWRDEDVGDVSMYDSLVEYLQGWGELLAETRKGLTTPVTTEILGLSSSRLVTKQEGIELLFLPTKTGRNYVSKTEEREQEAESGRSGMKSAPVKVFNRKTTKEGGIDVVVEVTRDDTPQLRVRARRCNYGDDAVIKELSEETILKRLKDAMEVWETEHLSKM